MKKPNDNIRRAKGLSKSDFLLIATDPNPQQEIAKAWGISQSRVAHIKRDWTFKPDSFIVGDADRVLDRMVRARVHVNCVIARPPDNLGPRAAYVKWQRSILGKCLELVGREGVVFWNLKPILRDGISNRHDDILQGMPVRQLIIWERGLSKTRDRSVVPPSFEMVYIAISQEL